MKFSYLSYSYYNKPLIISEVYFIKIRSWCKIIMMLMQTNQIKKNSKLIKYFILAFFLALQSTDLLHDHHEYHDHDESHYCVACHAPNIDQDIVLQSFDFIVDFLVVATMISMVTLTKREKLTFDQLPRSPPSLLYTLNI